MARATSSWTTFSTTDAGKSVSDVERAVGHDRRDEAPRPVERQPEHAADEEQRDEEDDRVAPRPEHLDVDRGEHRGRHEQTADEPDPATDDLEQHAAERQLLEQRREHAHQDQDEDERGSREERLVEQGLTGPVVRPGEGRPDPHGRGRDQERQQAPTDALHRVDDPRASRTQHAPRQSPPTGEPGERSREHSGLDGDEHGDRRHAADQLVDVEPGGGRDDTDEQPDDELAEQRPHDERDAVEQGEVDPVVLAGSRVRCSPRDERVHDPRRRWR